MAKAHHVTSDVLTETDFQLLFEAVPGLYLVLSPNFDIKAASNAYLRTTMTKRDEVLGRSIFEVFPDNPAEPDATGVRNLRASLERVLTNRVPDAMAVQKYDIRRPDSEMDAYEERYWSPVNSPVFRSNGELAWIIHRVEDVTEFVRSKQKKSEEHLIAQEFRTRAEQMEGEIYLRAQELQRVNEELRNANQELVRLCQTSKSAEQRFRLLVESVTDYAIFMLDPQGNVASWNAGAERIKGYRADEIIGRHFSCFYPPEVVANGWPEQELQHAVKDGRFEDEGWRLRKDGSRFWANAVFTALWDEAGSLKGFSKVTRDLTERKRTEETLQKAHDDLERRVVERTAALNEANRTLQMEIFERRQLEIELRQRAADLAESNTKLSQSNQELHDFAYVASHDLKEPLRGIFNYSSFLIEDYAHKLDEEGRSKLQTLQQLSRRLDGLIDALLEFSRVGRLEFAIRPTDLNEVLAGVLESLRIRLEERGIEVNIPRPLPTVQCDHVRVGEVFRNLITNAMKYNDKPEKWIEIGYCQLPSTDNFERPNSGQKNRPLAYYVRDNGIGIPQKHFESVFRIFKRLHGRDRYGGGTGAGLTIVKRIVNRHDGAIWIDSTPGEGSTFYFTLTSSKESVNAHEAGAAIAHR